MQIVLLNVKKKEKRKKVRRVIQHDLKKNFTPIKIP